MLFTHFYLIQVKKKKKKIETWFVSPVSRKYHGTEPTTFLSAN